MDTTAGFDLASAFSVKRPVSSSRRTRCQTRISFADLGNIRLRLAVTGDGPPLLFLFGSGAAATIENAQPILDWFSTEFTVACPDQRGLGHSDAPPGRWTMADYASDAFAVADHLGWDRFAVLGVSFGGMVALEMAATDADRLERLVLWGTTPGGYAASYPLHELERLSEAERFRVFPGILDTRLRDRDANVSRPDGTVDAVADQPGPTDDRRRGLAQQLEARRGYDVIGRLGGFSAPTFIGAGSFDGLAALEDVRVLKNEIPHSELHVYEAGHLFFAETDALEDTLRFLLNGHTEPVGLPPGPAAERLLDWRSLADLFADQAERTPDSIALRCNGESVSYAELAQRAHQLARILIGRDVGPDSVVPILIDRSPQAFVAILGVLAAGGAFLALDPDAPVARSQTMIADCDADLVLTTQDQMTDAAMLGCRDVLALDDPDLLAELCRRSGERVTDRERNQPLAAHHASFVVYSSGSTGTPKGAKNTQAGIVNCLHWLRREIGLGAGDRMLHQTTLIFDVATLEIFLPLISGGVVVIARPRGQNDSSYIAGLIQSESVDVAVFVPTLLMNFLGEDAAPQCESLRHVVSLGEALTGRVQASCHDRLPGVTLWNSYGPCETAVLVTLWRCRRSDGDSPPPIGSPCPNADLLVLDEDLRPVPDGSEGELCVAGVPVAHGYVSRPQLTAEKFLPYPAGPPGAVMYRTGDVVSRRPDGAYMFHGRRDAQIKLNGVRVEPGEVEAGIAAIPQIARVAVIAREIHGQQRLVAYLIVRPHVQKPDLATLTTEVAQRLPWSMVPSYFVYVDEFPLTESGKLATRKLPDPDLVTDERIDLYTDAERTVRDRWVEVLGHNNFGANDNFFVVGGRSIEAARLQSLLAAEFGPSVPLPRTFLFATVRAQAQWLMGYAAEATHDCLVVLEPRGEKPALYLIHGWGGGISQFRQLASALAPDRPVYGLQFVGEDLMNTGVAALADQYAERILRHHRNGPIHLLGGSAGGWYAYAVAAALLERGAELGTLVVLDSHAGGADVHLRLRLALMPLRAARKLRRLRRRSSAPIRSVVQPERIDAGAEPLDPYDPRAHREKLRPARLPITAHLFGPPGDMRRLRRTWRFYVRGGVECTPMFTVHNDFWDRPDLAPELAAAVERTLTRHETASAAR